MNLAHLSKAPLVIAGLLLTSSGCGAPAHDRLEDLPPITASLGEAERIELPQRVELSGTVRAGRSAAVSARVMAVVTAIPVRAGDRVEKGQLLAEIDPQAAKGQLTQAEGGLAQARAALSLAERNHRRFQALAEKEAASPMEADLARMQYEQAQGAVRQAEGAVSAASAVASDSQVVAPFAGRVARRLVDVGDLAAPGRPLLLIDSEASRRLSLSVPESVAASAGLSLGDRVDTRIDSLPQLGTLEAEVVEISPADPRSHSVDVLVELPTDQLPTGAAGRAFLTTGRRASVSIPEDALLRRGGLDLVVVVDGGRSSTRTVALGAPLGEGRIEVLAGLAGGETLALGLAAAPPTGTPIEGGSR